MFKEPGCDYCFNDAAFSITLDSGEEWNCCGECIERCIRENASTQNPVHNVNQFADSCSLVE